MRQNTAPIRREDYTPPAHAVERVDLCIAIYDDHAEVRAKLAVRRQGDDPSALLVLNGAPGMRLDAISVDGKALDAAAFDTKSGRIEIPIEKDTAIVETTTTIDPYNNTALEGLYLSGDMLCTQCEPEGFRHITWHPDRPDVLGVYTTRIEAPKRFPVLLANGNPVASGALDGDRHYAVWEDPHPKPSYLFAMVAGDLEYISDTFKTMHGREVELRIYTEHGNAARAAHAMASLKRAMQWDEETYGLAYDLDIFMIVAVSHFNMGAMENKGLNIFNSKYILADGATASDTDLQNVEAVVAHEYFHNWTGNRITCRDWFQLTLKEGLTVYRDQEFTSDMHARGVKRTDDVALLRAVQFPEDAGPTAHPIRPEEYSAINNFYTPTVYEKGAEVIRMISALLGRDGFMAGMRLYVERHDGAAVACEDFIRAMEDGGGADLRQFRRWYAQAGTPQLTITRAYDAAAETLTLRLSQRIEKNAADTAREPLPMPICFGLIGADGKAVPIKRKGSRRNAPDGMIYLDSAEQEEVLEQVPPGTVPSLLRGFSAPVQLHDDLTDDERLHLLAHDTDAFGRWDAGQMLMTDAVRGFLAGGEGDGDDRLQKLGAALAQVVADEKLDGATRAQILRLPSQAVMEQAMQPQPHDKNTAKPDPVAIWQARRDLIRTLGQTMDAVIAEQLTRFAAETDGPDAGGRALYLRLLGFAVAAGGDEGDADAIAHAQSLAAHANMTLSEGALAALNQTATEARKRALADFADRWQGNPLVMEKWFVFESSAPLVADPAHCEELMQHPAFDSGNPNKLRSVLGSFGSINTPRFHADDGSGYDFLARHIAAIDGRNPQVAARLVLPLCRFANYCAARAGKMRAAVESLAAGAISSDLREIVGKSLGAK